MDRIIRDSREICSIPSSRGSVLTNELSLDSRQNETRAKLLLFENPRTEIYEKPPILAYACRADLPSWNLFFHRLEFPEARFLVSRYLFTR